MRRRGVIGVGDVAPFDPLAIAWHTVFWAEDPNWTPPADGAAVAQWDDASGNAHHASQATAANRPLYRASVAGLNNKPAVEFDGSNDFLLSPTFAGITPEVVVVARLTTTAGSYGYWMDGRVEGNRVVVGRNNTGKWEIAQLTIIDNGTTDTLGHMFNARFAATDELYIDNSLIISGNAGTETLTGITVGSAINGASSWMPGQIAFLGVKSTALTAEERSDMLAWAQTHYATP